MDQEPQSPCQSAEVTGAHDQKREFAREEYDRCMDYNKHCTTIQFGQISVFLAAMTACIVFFYGEHPPSEPLLTFGKLGVAFVAFCLWIAAESHGYMSAHFFKRAAELERSLGYQGLSQMPGMPHYKYGPAKWALRAVYCAFTLFWVAVFAVGVV